MRYTSFIYLRDILGIYNATWVGGRREVGFTEAHLCLSLLNISENARTDTNWLTIRKLINCLNQSKYILGSI